MIIVHIYQYYSPRANVAIVASRGGSGIGRGGFLLQNRNRSPGALEASRQIVALLIAAVVTSVGALVDICRRKYLNDD